MYQSGFNPKSFYVHCIVGNLTFRQKSVKMLRNSTVSAVPLMLPSAHISFTTDIT